MKLPTISHPIINHQKIESFGDNLENLFQELYGEIKTDFSSDTQAWFTPATNSQMQNEFIKQVYSEISQTEERWQLDKDIAIEYNTKNPTAIYRDKNNNSRTQTQALIFETYPQHSKTLSIIHYACSHNAHIYWLKNMSSGKGMLLLFLFSQDDPDNMSEFMKQETIQAFYDKCENWIFENRKTISSQLSYEKAFQLQQDFYHYVKTGESLKSYKQDIEDKIAAVPDKVDAHLERIHGPEPKQYSNEDERLLWDNIHETRQCMIECEIDALTYEDKLSYDVIGMDWRDLPETN